MNDMASIESQIYAAEPEKNRFEWIFIAILQNGWKADKRILEIMEKDMRNNRNSRFQIPRSAPHILFKPAIERSKPKRCKRDDRT